MPPTPPAHLWKRGGSSGSSPTITALIVAAALVIAIAVVILLAILYSCRADRAARWQLGRRGLDAQQTASIVSCSSWHVYPDATSATSIGGCSMVLDSALTHAIGVPPEYIPYRGPIEPPPLPYPEKTAWQERELPAVPMRQRSPLIKEGNVLGLSFDTDDWRASIPPRYGASITDSVILELPSPAVTSRALNAHRSVARLLPLTGSTDGSGADPWPWSGNAARPAARNTLPALPVAIVDESDSPRRNASRISVRNYSLSAVPGAYRDVLRCRASAPPPSSGVPCPDQSPPTMIQVPSSSVSIQPSVP
ncbi:hypothetical protein Q8F55_002667 [Vanrija albida]|uniref:Uncharacterized protein n=1 Tax=Vanrija albida TaxID=181172 RepID=A0ABR3QAF0_9TREE